MKRPFKNAQDAKEFLISRIVSQAQFEGIPLSEIERRALYGNAPDLREVRADFEQSYDPYVYEQKITALMRTARKRDLDLTDENKELWEKALQFLSDGDYYLAKAARQGIGSPHRRYTFCRLIASAVLAIALLAVLLLVFRRLAQ